MCGVAGAYQQPDGKVVVNTMIDRLGHRGSGRLRRARDRGPRHRRPSGPPPAVDHRPVDRGRPAVRQGRADPQLQRRALQLPRARAELEGTRRALRHELRHRGRPRGVAALGHGVAAAASAACSRSRSTNRRPGRLTLARDPLGIKPLYVMRRGDGVLFASELKAIVAAVGTELTIDPAAWSRRRSTTGSRRSSTPSRACSKLPAGIVGRVPPGRLSQRGHVLATRPRSPPTRLQAARRTCASVIEESVAAHLVADVPVASFLSGGLDSSIITALAHRHDPGIEAYTIAFRAEDQRLEAMPDDARYARKMAAHLGIRLHEIEIRPDVVELLPRMVDMLDEPIGDPAAINTLLMCEAARDAGVKVLLSGMGADELFGGYRKHLACLLSARYRRIPGPRAPTRSSPAVRRLPVAVGGRGMRTVRWAQRFLTFAELPEEAAFRRSYTLYDEDELAGLLDPDARRSRRRQSSTAHAPGLRRTTPVRPRQPDVPGGHPDVHAGPQPDLHRPGEHGRLDRGPRAVRRSRGVPGGVLAARLGQDRRPRPEGGPQAGRAGVAARRDHRPAQGLLRRAAARLGHQRPARAHRRRRWSAASSSQPDSSGGTRCCAWSPTSAAGRRDESKQIWQLLSLELWYRNARAPAYRPPEHDPSPDRPDVHRKAHEAGSPELPVRRARGAGRASARRASPAASSCGRSYSLISTGTELMKVTEARLSLLGKARARPDQVRKLMESVATAGSDCHLQEGDEPARQLHPSRLLAVRRRRRGGCRSGARVPRSVRLVAAAGNEFALHAEVNWVPTNLCVPVPDGVAPEHAAFATVGAIAMQGVRRGEVAARGDRMRHRARTGRPAGRPTAPRGRRPAWSGSTRCEERCRMAEKAGALLCAGPDAEGVSSIEQALLAATGGFGADHVFLAAGGELQRAGGDSLRGWRGTAHGSSTSARPSWTCPGTTTTTRSSTSGSPVPTGPGATTTHTSSTGSTTRSATSAGPNAATCAASSTCSPRESHRRRLARSLASHAIEDAAGVYEQLRTGALHGVGFLLEYPQADQVAAAEQRPALAHDVATTGPATRPSNGNVRLGFIGAGNYAASMLLPHLAKDDARHAGLGRHDAVAVRGQRAAQVRLPDREHRRGGRAGRPEHRRRLRGDATPFPRRLRLRGAAPRQGRLRREAARSDSMISCNRCSTRSTRPATTG